MQPKEDRVILFTRVLPTTKIWLEEAKEEMNVNSVGELLDSIVKEMEGD